MYTGGILCIFSRTSAGRGHQTTIPGPGRQAAPSPPYEGGGKVPGRQVGSILEPCLQPLPCSLGSWGRGGSGDDTEKGCLLVVSVLNIRERGKHHRTHGIETSKSPRLVGIQHHRGPQKAKGAAWGPGGGRGAKGSFPSPCTRAMPPSSLLAAGSLSGCSSEALGEVLVASKHLNIA